MNGGIYLKGIDKLERNTNLIIKDLTSNRTKVLRGQAQKVRDRIREKAPLGPVTDKHPGSLKAAAYANALPETVSTRAVAFAGIRPRKAPHAHLVEFGHGGPHPAPPHPFVRPAWDEMKDQIKQEIAEGMRKIIEGAVE